jgi:hypothetical protein
LLERFFVGTIFKAELCWVSAANPTINKLPLMRRGESLLFELKRIDDKLRGIAMKPFIKKETYFVFTHKSINSHAIAKAILIVSI